MDPIDISGLDLSMHPWNPIAVVFVRENKLKSPCLTLCLLFHSLGQAKGILEESVTGSQTVQGIIRFTDRTHESTESVGRELAGKHDSVGVDVSDIDLHGGVVFGSDEAACCGAGGVATSESEHKYSEASTRR